MADVTLLTAEMHEDLRAKYHEAWKLLQTATPDVDKLNNAECEAWQMRRDTLLFHDMMRCDGCGKTIAEHDRLGRCSKCDSDHRKAWRRLAFALVVAIIALIAILSGPR